MCVNYCFELITLVIAHEMEGGILYVYDTDFFFFILFKLLLNIYMYSVSDYLQNSQFIDDVASV